MKRMNKISDDLRQERGPLDADWSEQAIELENSEVLEGLEPGERIITSPYTSYLDMQRLLLN